MKLAEICLERPVLASVLSLLLILAGVIGFKQLDLQFEPSVFRPHLAVYTVYPGASAKEVEQSVTDKLEKALADTPNLEMMSSYSTEGSSEIDLDFKAISKVDFVTIQSQVAEKVATVDLPEQAKQPNIYTHSSNSQLMFIGVYDPNMSEVQLINYTNDVLVNRLQRIPGVSDVKMAAMPATLYITLNPLKLVQYGLTERDILDALGSNNASASIGVLRSHDQQISLNGHFQLADVTAFQNVIVSKVSGQFIRLKDVAKVYVAPGANKQWFTEIDGHPGTGINISYADGANPIALGDKVRAVLQKMQATYPPGLETPIVFDISKPLKQSILEVVYTIFQAIALVVLVTFLFLGNIRATFIPFVTIPVCLIGACFVMYLLGFSLNVMTLLAIVLAVGLVVDDAIVVLENNHRHLVAGMLPLAAAEKSLKEISFAVIGMTICLIAVYLPAGFMEQDTTGVYYHQFAYTLAAAVGISGFVALTLSPMMCGRVLSVHRQTAYERFLERSFSGLRTRYQQLLLWTLMHKKWVVCIFIMGIVIGVSVFVRLPTGFLPTNNMDMMVVPLSAPSTANTQYTQAQTDKIMAQVIHQPFVQHSVSFSNPYNGGTNFSLSFLALTPASTRLTSNETLAKQVNDLIDQVPEMAGHANILNINSDHNSSRQGNMTVYLTGAVSYHELQQATLALAKALKEVQAQSGLIYADSSLNQVQQEYDFHINRELASLLGVPIENILLALQTYYGGYQLPTSYIYGGQSYDVLLRLPLKDLADFQALQRIYVNSSQGDKVALKRLVTIEPSFGLPQLTHINQLRAGELYLSLEPGYSLGQAMATLEQVVRQALPSTITLGYEGDALKFQKENNSMLMIFVLGLLFIYLVLSALFESFRDPLIILFTVPLCVTGGLILLKAIGGQLDMYTIIGFVTLIGLVAKHGVLITQFANQLQEAGRTKQEAVIEAAALRLRPILMTTLTMVLGALPLVLATGSGAKGRLEIGTVVVSGLMLGTLFSLFIVPTAYMLLAKNKKGVTHAHC